MSAAARLLKSWRKGGDARTVLGKLIAQDRKERPAKISHPAIGDEFKARAGGVGTWIVVDSELVDGHYVFHLYNPSLGQNFMQKVDFQWIRENLE